MVRRIASLLILIAVPIGCGPRPLASDSLLANPAKVDFGKHAVFSTNQMGIALRNIGGAPLENVTFVVAPSEFKVQPAPTPLEPLIIQPDESIALVVTFAPNAAGQKVGMLRITTQDEEDTGLAIPLQGFADGPEMTPVDAGSPCCFDAGQG